MQAYSEWAFVNSRFNYCHSLSSGLPASTLRPLQLVQNSASYLLYRSSKFTDITTILHHTRWLSIKLSRMRKILITFVTFIAPFCLFLILNYYFATTTAPFLFLLHSSTCSSLFFLAWVIKLFQSLPLGFEKIISVRKNLINNELTIMSQLLIGYLLTPVSVGSSLSAC